EPASYLTALRLRGVRLLPSVGPLRGVAAAPAKGTRAWPGQEVGKQQRRFARPCRYCPANRRCFECGEGGIRIGPFSQLPLLFTSYAQVICEQGFCPVQLVPVIPG